MDEPVNGDNHQRSKSHACSGSPLPKIVPAMRKRKAESRPALNRESQAWIG
jgi:hypothetical protein